MLFDSSSMKQLTYLRIMRSRFSLVPRSLHTLSCLQPDHQSARLSSTAYQGIPGDGKLGINSTTVPYLPLRTKLISLQYNQQQQPGDVSVEVGTFETKQEFEYAMQLMNQVIREGTSWPFEQEFKSLDDFKGYFSSHAAFLVRRLPDSLVPINNEQQLEETNRIMGCFYIKPNFPGRCSHICNGGFITAPQYRRMGVGRLMGTMYLRLAKSLGYKSSYFNLVFESNVASVRLWESLGFQQVARLERAARLRHVERNVLTDKDDESVFWDTALGYRYDLETLSDK